MRRVKKEIFILLVLFCVLTSSDMIRIFIVQFNSREETLKVRLSVDSSMTVRDLNEKLKSAISDSCITDFEYYDNDSGKYVHLDADSTIREAPYHSVLAIEETNSDTDMLMIEGRAFNVKEGLNIGDTTLIVAEKLNRSEGTGLNTWDGSIVLAKYLDTFHGRQLVTDKTILEVGAGTGTAGLAASLLGASLVVLTDLDYVLPNLEENARSVEERKRSYNGEKSVHVLPLDWADPTTYIRPSDIRPSMSKQWDVILAADVVWLDELVPLLVKALVALASPVTTVLVAHQSRSLKTESLFFSLLEERFYIDRVPPSELHPDYLSPKINIYKCHLKHP